MKSTLAYKRFLGFCILHKYSEIISSTRILAWMQHSSHYCNSEGFILCRIYEFTNFKLGVILKVTSEVWFAICKKPHFALDGSGVFYLSF